MRYLSFLLSTLTLTLDAHAAAWLQPKNQGVVITDYQQYQSCQYWDRDGTLHKGDCFNQSLVSPYMEYGLNEKVTFAIAPVFNSFSQGNQSVNFGLENGFIGGRFSLMKDDWSELSFQLGYNQPFRYGRFGNTPSSTVAIIDRQRFLDFRLLYGTGGPLDEKQNKTWYGDIETSYQDNFNGAADEYHLNFLLGCKTLDGKLVFEIQEFNTLSFNNPTNSTFPNYNLFTVLPDIIYWFTPTTAIQVGIQQDLWGTNIGRGTAGLLGFWWKLT